MRIVTIFAYLVGRRRAILEVASDRRALGVAAMLVLSAALARNYDQAPLLHEPWRLLGPFIASLPISGPLFLTIYGVARSKGMGGPGIGSAYRSFLSLYWMTAPMAWLYGIPYERFLSSVEAVEANLRTLALVSAWRVALMIRVVSVVFGLRMRLALALVMLVADAAALTALHLAPLPVIHVMGGIRPEQDKIAWTALLATVVGWLTLPVWIVLALVPSDRTVPEWQVPSTSDDPRSGRGPLVFAGLILAAWAAALLFTQLEQIRARRVERTYRNSGPAAAVALMSSQHRSDYPPDWLPPPRRFLGEPSTSEILDMLEVLTRTPHADWVEDLYSQQFQERTRYDRFSWPGELLREHVVRLAAHPQQTAPGASNGASTRGPFGPIV